MESKVQKNGRNSKDKALELSQLFGDENNTRVPKFGVSFFERSEKTAKGRSVIYVVGSFRGKSYKKSLSIGCKQGSLDGKTATIKGDKENSLLLQTIERRIGEMVANFRITGKKIEVKKIIDSVLTRNNIIDKCPDIGQICKMLLDDIAQKYQLGEITLKSFKRYEMNFDRLNSFLSIHFHSNFIELSEISQHTVERYVRWLKLEYSFEPETIKKALQVGRMVYKVAQQNRWFEFNPFTNIKLGKSKSLIENYLTQEEVVKLIQLDLASQIYSDIRDIFIFQCYTSLAYTDVKHLRKSHIVEGDNFRYIQKPREKTNNVQTILLFPISVEILDRHKEKSDIFCFNCYTNTHHNRILKELAALAEIKKPISTHWARKTFSRLMIKNGISKEGLQSVLAHSSIKITEKHYVNTSQQRALDEMHLITSKLK